ncbi:DNA repair exonuclease SbcCD nuclease subunit [Bacillus tianshenii]|uniref:DNA repair exonuclease SbcCD nuclease subunit n=1 Tax=Sutcliffiella tianshenii TaxID=1463404 RepID=A0ABS2P1G5_9BACI|nr:DNA repair exonuclease [Bacillus tianshenii]MBM7620778.1 DNA repair exonuclease SbcCD nuclease subunit [Bacillus tianshenii]
MNAIRFIHAADLHLDSPFKGLNHLPQEIFEQVRSSTFSAFTKLVDIAIEEKVDFLVLAGDLFDMELRSLMAQAKLREEFLRLEEAAIEVYAIHGNHDFIGEGSLHFRYPKNVHIFNEKVASKRFMKNGEHIANIYGFSYDRRHVLQNRTSEYLKKDPDIPYHIGILHGNLSGREEHDPYAPFSLPELLEKKFQYWALGHIHKREILHENPPVIYPGNIQGRNKKETGEKGCYLVELDQYGAKMTFKETATILWKELKLSIASIETVDELLQEANALLEKSRQEERASLIRIVLTGGGPLFVYLQDESILEDLQQYLNEGEQSQPNFQLVYSIANQTAPSFNKAELRQKAFYEDFYKVVEDSADIKSFLDPLFKHSDARSFLEPLKQEDHKAILEEAEQWLITKFLESEKR